MIISSFSRIHPIHAIILLVGLLFAGCSSTEKQRIITVNGEINASELGKTLEHEHILVDFIRQEDNQPEYYSTNEVIRVVLPYLNDLKMYGVNSFFECTPVFLGRDVNLLKRISDETGLNIITNTGYYGAQTNRFIPQEILLMSAQEIAEQWIDEFQNGIDETGIRPGFIKIGVDRKPLSEFHATLARAAAITHKSTGLTIMSHTGLSVPALQQLEILREEGVAPEAFIWTHASDEEDWSKIVSIAKSGAWVSLDKYGWDEKWVEDYPKLLQLLKSEGVLNKVLISQDAGYVDPGQPEQVFRPYTLVFKELIPNLKSNGFTEEDINQIFITNPANAFTVKKRLIEEP